jgi:hypothetical protein
MAALPTLLVISLVVMTGVVGPAQIRAQEDAPKRRAILIGVDGLMPEEIDRFKDDILEVACLLEKGFFSPAIEPPYTDTGTNWNTIQTSTWVGTHGMTGFEVRMPGMRLSESIGGRILAVGLRRWCI